MCRSSFLEKYAGFIIAERRFNVEKGLVDNLSFDSNVSLSVIDCIISPIN